MRLALTVLLALAATACTRDAAPVAGTAAATPPAPAATNAVELRAYATPPELAGELANVLNGQFYRNKEEPPIGRAHVGPGGQLLVTAPASVQTGVEALVKSVGDAPPEPPPVVEVTYWSVVAKPSTAEAAPSPDLAEIAPALEAIRSVEGPRAFTLEEKLRVQQVSGSEANVRGMALSARQSASAREGVIVADLSLHRNQGPGDLATQVALPVGKLLVLGQAGGHPDEGTGAPVSVYFIVRATVLGPTGE